jgi:hypothetical protein
MKKYINNSWVKSITISVVATLVATLLLYYVFGIGKNNQPKLNENSWVYEYCDVIISKSEISDSAVGLQNDSNSRICIQDGTVFTRNGINIKLSKPATNK